MWRRMTLVLCIGLAVAGLPALAQDLDSRHIYPLGPINPTDSQTCSAYRQQISNISSAYDKKHQECLDAHSKDKSTASGPMMCSEAACQNLHDIVYGSLKKIADQRVDACNDEVSKYKALQQKIKQDRQKAESAERAMNESNQRQAEKQAQAMNDARTRELNAQVQANNNAAAQVDQATANLQNAAANSRAAADRSAQQAEDLRQRGESLKQQRVQVDDSQLNQLAALSRQSQNQTSVLFAGTSDADLPAAAEASVSNYLENAEANATAILQQKIIQSLSDGLPDWAADYAAKAGSKTAELAVRSYNVWQDARESLALWRALGSSDPSVSLQAMGEINGKSAVAMISNPSIGKFVAAEQRNIGIFNSALMKTFEAADKQYEPQLTEEEQSYMNDPANMIPGVYKARQMKIRVEAQYEKFLNFIHGR